MDCSMPGFPVFHYVPDFAQTHVHWCLPIISSSVLNLPQHQSLFQWVSSLHQVARVLELQLQHQSFQWNIQGWFPLGLTGLILQSKRLSRVFSSNHSLKASVLHCSVFFMVQPSHLYTTTGKTTVLTIQTFVVKVMSLLFNMLSRFVIAFLLRNNVWLAQILIHLQRKGIYIMYSNCYKHNCFIYSSSKISS